MFVRERNDGEVAGKDRRRIRVPMTLSAFCSLIKYRFIWSPVGKTAGVEGQERLNSKRLTPSRVSRAPR